MLELVCVIILILLMRSNVQRLFYLRRWRMRWMSGSWRLLVVWSRSNDLRGRLRLWRGGWIRGEGGDGGV